MICVCQPEAVTGISSSMSSGFKPAADANDVDLMYLGKSCKRGGRVSGLDENKFDPN